MIEKLPKILDEDRSGDIFRESQSPLQILAVDDDKEDFFAIQRLLRSAEGREFDIVYIDNYDDAIETLQNQTFDLILLDYFIGNRAGTEIFDAFEEPVNSPVIILTGSGDRDAERETLTAGAFDFLDKNELNSVALLRSIDFAMRRFEIEGTIRDRQERFRRAYENAEAAHVSKSEFLEFLGQEVRTPLNAIIGFSQAMNDESLRARMPEQCQEYARTINASGLHLNNLVEDLLELSQTESNSFDIRSRRFKRYRTWIVDREETKTELRNAS